MSEKTKGIISILLLALIACGAISYISGRKDEAKVKCQEFKWMINNLEKQLEDQEIYVTISLPSCR